jgi:SAM-dependent methyltransferase
MTRSADSWTFMNYGYDYDGAPPRLEPEDEAERYCSQLYHQAVGSLDLSGKDVLEISCGRGGGASYVKRYLGARTMTGLDLSENQIDFCRRVHRIPGLSFVAGPAEAVPLPDASFDVVINVEASCLYRDTAQFFREVNRLLRPGGQFVYADIHRIADLERLDAELSLSGLRRSACRDITPNVLRALERDNERRLAGIRRYAPAPIRFLIKSFAGTRGTRIPNGLADGSLVYLSFVLERPATAKEPMPALEQDRTLALAAAS